MGGLSVEPVHRAFGTVRRSWLIGTGQGVVAKGLIPPAAGGSTPPSVTEVRVPRRQAAVSRGDSGSAAVEGPAPSSVWLIAQADIWYPWDTTPEHLAVVKVGLGAERNPPVAPTQCRHSGTRTVF